MTWVGNWAWTIVNGVFTRWIISLIVTLTKVQISVRKVNLIIELVEPVDNILDAMTPLLGGTDEDPFVFNEDVFREELLEFINTGEIGSQASWQNYTNSAEKYARQLALQDNTLIIETTPTELIIMKMSEEMLKGLE